MLSRRGAVLAAISLALISASCGANQGSEHVLSRPAKAEPSVSVSASVPVPPAAVLPEKRAALRFDVDGTTFPSPLVDAIVDGQPTTLIVDTGATQHVIASWLTAELSLPLEKGAERALDHTGREVPVLRLPHAHMSISGWGSLDEASLLVVDVPEVLQRMNIGGFLSPQALAGPGRAVVLDLREGQMWEGSVEESARKLASRADSNSRARQGISTCRGSIAGLRLFVPLIIEGIAVRMQIDSGASQSSLFMSSPAGKELSSRSSSSRTAYAASGAYTVPILESASMRLGAFESKGDVDFLPQGARSDCPSDGFVGMDVLKSCVLLLAEEGAEVACERKSSE